MKASKRGIIFKVSMSATLIALVVLGGYLWHRECLWRVQRLDGSGTCRVGAGWTEMEVKDHCGARTGRGCLIKMFKQGPGGLFDLQACSSSGDVYGAKVVIYGCDGRVASVEEMPASMFVYPCDEAK